MVTATPVYSSSVAMTITLASLASDTNLVAGRESTAVDQKDTDDAVDCLVGGKVTTGTSPTANRQIEIWLYGSYDDTEFGGAATGSDATLTPSPKSGMKLLEVIPTSSTNNVTYKWGPYSVANAFGGFVPVRWGVYVVQNTGANLNSTGSNHEVVYFPIKFESA